MATTGVMLRRGLQADLISNPPIVGELVYATDLGMHGWLDETSTLVWKKINEVVEAGGTSTLSASAQAVLNPTTYDNDYEMFTFNYTADQEITITYKVTMMMNATQKYTANGQVTIHAGLLSLATDANPVSIGLDGLELFATTDGTLSYAVGNDNYNIKLQRNIDGTCKLFLHGNTNQSSYTLFMTYEIIETNFGATATARYPTGG